MLLYTTLSETEASMAAKPFAILLFGDLRRDNASTIHDHVDGFGYYSKNEVYVYNPIGKLGSGFLDLNEFDVVVLHYSLCTIYDSYLHPRFKEQLAKYQGLKVQFIQDDYRQVNAFIKVMREIGIHVLFTLCPASRIPLLWPDDRLPGVKKYTTLAGYVPDYLLNRQTPTLAERTLDVGYRSRDVPYWLGTLGHEKTLIVKRFIEHAPAHGLKFDLSTSEKDRLYGPRWTSFVKSCKTMLGSESGASIADFDGTAEAKVRSYLRHHPRALFEEVHEAVLRPFEGNVIVNCISPRAFEATALGTAMVLFPGEYSGILRPWDHYIPLEKDFSNFAEVARKIRDLDFLGGMTRRAYQDLIASERYSYRAFIREFDAIIEAHASHIAVASKFHYECARQEPPTMPQEMVRLFRRSLRGIKNQVLNGSAALTGLLKKPA
jgi:hypothetical protein